MSSPTEKDGWILLFDGESDKGWMTSGWEACPEVVDQGAINPSSPQAGGRWLGHGLRAVMDEFRLAA
jgi:hypothetical protein